MLASGADQVSASRVWSSENRVSLGVAVGVDWTLSASGEPLDRGLDPKLESDHKVFMVQPRSANLNPRPLNP